MAGTFSKDHAADARRLRELLGNHFVVRTASITPTSLHVMIERDGKRVANYWPSTGKLTCGEEVREGVPVQDIPEIIGAVPPAISQLPQGVALLDTPINLGVYNGKRWRDIPVEHVEAIRAAAVEVLRLRRNEPRPEKPRPQPVVSDGPAFTGVVDPTLLAPWEGPCEFT